MRDAADIMAEFHRRMAAERQASAAAFDRIKAEGLARMAAEGRASRLAIMAIAAEARQQICPQPAQNDVAAMAERLAPIAVPPPAERRRLFGRRPALLSSLLGRAA